jgi:hypothetical protein
MTEETPKKKPRKKRRTKAEIAAEAEKLAADEAAKQSALIAESEKEEDCVTCGGETAEKSLAAAEEAVKETPEPKEPYIELTGLAKIRARIEQRKLRRMHGQQ